MMVNDQVRRPAQRLQIARRVVERVLVDVMHDVSCWDWPVGSLVLDTGTTLEAS